MQAEFARLDEGCNFKPSILSEEIRRTNRFWSDADGRRLQHQEWKGSRKKICRLAQKQREFRFLRRWPSSPPQNHSASFPWPVNPETYYRISQRFAAARQAYFACTIFPAGHQLERSDVLTSFLTRRAFERFPANFPSNV